MDRILFIIIFQHNSVLERITEILRILKHFENKVIIAQKKVLNFNNRLDIFWLKFYDRFYNFERKKITL